MNVEFINASQWNELEWYNSGGTRAKRVLQSIDNKEWYFKCSERKPGKGGLPEKYYKFEFWSEIISYQLGSQLGLNILRYDVGIHNSQIGCISPLMIKREEEQLVEVGRYMTALDSEFLPADNKTRNKYTFQLLESIIEKFDFVQYWDFFFQTILFDAIIGNTDRHQENWAFLARSAFKQGNEPFITPMELNVKPINKSSIFSFLKRRGRNNFNLARLSPTIELLINNIVGTAPIYDSGSSLGRELNENKINELLNNEELLRNYIDNGKCEVHWEFKKLTHFKLIEKLLNSCYQEQVIFASSFLERWDENFVTELINGVDKNVPQEWHSYCIPAFRKKLIIKLLILRSEKLRRLLHD